MQTGIAGILQSAGMPESRVELGVACGRRNLGGMSEKDQ